MTEAAFHHFYGIMDGILLTIVGLLCLFSLKHYVRYKDTRLAQTYCLLAISFLGFEGFNIFLQQAHQAPTMGFYPAWLVKLGSLAVPASMAIMTYFYGHAMGLYSYSASKALRRVKWFTRIIYLSLVLIFLILLFSTDISFMTSLIIASFLLPCLSGTYVAWKSMIAQNTSKLITYVMLVLVAGNLIMLWYSFGGRLLGKATLMLGVHLTYGVLLILICHILLSMGRDELNDVFKRYSLEKKRIISDIASGLTKSQFSLHYQPQINLKQNNISGVEALIRWNHPQKGNISPGKLIPIAEEAGLIQNITMWVIEQAVRDARRLMDKGHPLQVSINFSPSCFKKSVVEYLGKQLKTLAVPPKLIIIEITENVMFQEDDPEMQAAFKQLHKLGVSLSIDDYGTGFSSLSYLKKMAVSELKIDRSFVTDMLVNKDSFAIVESTMQMSRSLDISVVAEGIENEAVLYFLTEMGCEKAQGYDIARPMPFDKLLAYLDAR